MTTRIALDIHSIGMRKTGNETYVRNLVEQFSRMNAPWTYLYYHTVERDALDTRGWKGELRRLRPHTPLVRIPFSFPWALWRDRASLAHFQYVAPPLCPCPTVVTVHDISYEFFPEYFPVVERKRMQTMIPLSARRAAHVITISEFSRQSIIERYSIPEDRITVTPLGVSPAFRRLHEADALAVTNRFELHRPFVLGVGNLQPRKNLERLIRAFARVCESTGCPHELVLVGPLAWRGHKVQQEAERLGITSRVRQTGYVSEEELIGLYNRAEVFAYPSTFEGFGLPVIEAMACGAPVLTSSTSSIPEVAGDAAVMIDPYDEDEMFDRLEFLIGNPAERDRLRALGVPQAQKFDWRTTAESTVRIYEQVLG